jgi:DNA-binding Lrp family transcriptional regulator
MKELKPLDYKLLSELIKNSRRSDRELAKAIGVSQPTITRRRALIEKELIDGYTAIPKWEKLGYELLLSHS